MQQELKEAFRLYDREGKINLILIYISMFMSSTTDVPMLNIFSGNGYITTSTLKEILAALDDKLNNADLDGIIAEIDTDGSGTVDFDGNFLIHN